VLHYIVPMNEPDSGGEWSTSIPAEVYNVLAKSLRSQLDAAGFSNVRIPAPGFTFLGWDGHNQQWINGLDDEAVKAIGVWATHAWDDGKICTGGADCIEQVYPIFGDPATKRDPTKAKWVTEYATHEHAYNDTAWGNPDDSGSFSASFCMGYAAATIENSLALLNSGTNRAFYWSSQDGVQKSWGWVDKNGKKKPILDALMALFPIIQPGASIVVSPVQSKLIQPVYAGVYVNLNGSVVVAAANSQYQAHDVDIVLVGAPKDMNIRYTAAAVLAKAGDPIRKIPDESQLIHPVVPIKESGGVYTLHLSLPPVSTLTVMLST